MTRAVFLDRDGVLVEDTGALVAWLASPGAAYVTGQIVLNNGGSVLH